MRCPPRLRRVSSELVALLHSQTHRQHQLAPARRPPARAFWVSGGRGQSLQPPCWEALQWWWWMEGDPGGAAMVVVEGDPAGAAVALEGEENVAKNQEGAAAEL